MAVNVKAVLLGASIALCSCILLLTGFSLSFPWYTETVDVEGTFSSLYFSISTHAFYWNYYCEGNGCSLMSFNRDPNGFYSWYDVCTDCDSQLTLYIAAWVSSTYLV